MEIALRVFSMSVSVIVFFFVMRMLVKRNLNESNSILWLFIGFITLIAGFFPKLIDRMAALAGIDYPPTLLFLGSIIVLMMIVFRNSMDISKSDAKMNEMGIVVSLLKEENKMLKEALAELRSTGSEQS